MRTELARLMEERSRARRSRLTRLVFLGLAFSLPFHVGILIWLALVEVRGPAVSAPEAVVIDLSVLTETELEEMSESIDIESLDPPSLEDDSAEQSIELDAVDPLVSADSLQPTLDGALPTVGGSNVGAGDDGIGGGAGSASFFGVQARGKRFAYLVDISGSMESENKIGTAMAELKRSLVELPDYASFAVFLFSTRGTVPPFQDNWMKVSRANVTRTSRWIDTVKAGGSTNPLSSFEAIFALEPRPDVIFFLTDGQVDATVPAQVRALNRTGRRVTINTISFGADAVPEPMIEIAEDSGGLYRHVETGRRR